ncbi:G-protein coupled receptor moody-like [Spodoptera frugiperda]|uniref:G-protein coupled receptor moody-like n=1 Tax=Spodoptera frugiperda TaxID=7108 RepID=A0A9R0D272_SPOFR|nr:G-protein coupled receptor moody-like [Spodoptera frugiperda]
MACDYTKAKFGMSYSSGEDLASVKLFKCYSDTLLGFASACCVAFMVIGIPGNLTTIIALARCRKVRNATAIFIINLHICDVIFGSLILPLTAITFLQKHWTHGWTMCRVYAYCKFTLNAVSIFTVLAITINRYIIVCHPLWYPKIYKRRNMTMMLILIWTLASALFLPSYFGVWGRFDLEPNGGFCTMLEDKNGNSPKKYFLTIAFIGPYLTIAISYAIIWWVVMKTAKKTRGQNPRPMRPSHLPLVHTQSETSTDGRTLISFDPASPTNSTTDDDKTPPSSASSTPRDNKTFEKYFKAPFRLTIKEVRPRAPTRRDKKLFAMIAGIMLSYNLTHLPLMVTRLVYKEYKSEPYANVSAHLLSYLGTCINPIVYVLMSNEYRHAYRSLFEDVINKFRRQQY